MVRDGYFAHDRGVSTLEARVIRSGYLGSNGDYDLAENLGEGTNADASPAAIVAAWMDSPDHRANILEPGFRDSGIGIVAAVDPSFADGQRGATYIQDFGRRGR
jgi:uncharacterized protein YkwD